MNATKNKISKEVLQEAANVLTGMGIDAKVIGEVSEAHQVVLQFKGAKEILFDFDKESITGI